MPKQVIDNAFIERAVDALQMDLGKSADADARMRIFNQRKMLRTAMSDAARTQVFGTSIPLSECEERAFLLGVESARQYISGMPAAIINKVSV